MTVQELIDELSKQGVNIEAVGDELRINAPKGVLTSEVRQALAEQKQALLTLLKTPSASIGAAPTIQEPNPQEKELGALIEKLRELNRDGRIADEAKRKRVPLKALVHAASLWLSDNPDDWTAANDTIFQFTSPFGNKQL